MWQNIGGSRSLASRLIFLLQATYLATSSGPFQRVECVIRASRSSSTTSRSSVATKLSKLTLRGGHSARELPTLTTGIPRISLSRKTAPPLLLSSSFEMTGRESWNLLVIR